MTLHEEPQETYKAKVGRDKAAGKTSKAAARDVRKNPELTLDQARTAAKLFPRLVKNHLAGGWGSGCRRVRSYVSDPVDMLQRQHHPHLKHR